MIFAPTTENISLLAAEIRQGNCVAFPTETVYGLGADATNGTAIAQIFSTKQRPSLIRSLSMCQTLLPQQKSVCLMKPRWPWRKNFGQARSLSLCHASQIVRYMIW